MTSVSGLTCIPNPAFRTPVAASFYNSGEIDCGNILYCLGDQYRESRHGRLKCLRGGLIQLTGQDVDLTYSTLTVGGGGINGSVGGSIGVLELIRMQIGCQAMI